MIGGHGKKTLVAQMGTQHAIIIKEPRLRVQVLQAFWLRSLANQMAYHNKEELATEDAVRIGRLHTHLPGWLDANVAFMRSGGYVVSKRIKNVQQDTTVVWGEQDCVLDPTSGRKFVELLPHARSVLWCSSFVRSVLSAALAERRGI